MTPTPPPRQYTDAERAISKALLGQWNQAERDYEKRVGEVKRKLDELGLPWVSIQEGA